MAKSDLGRCFMHTCESAAVGRLGTKLRPECVVTSAESEVLFRIRCWSIFGACSRAV